MVYGVCVCVCSESVLLFFVSCRTKMIRAVKVYMYSLI